MTHSRRGFIASAVALGAMAAYSNKGEAKKKAPSGGLATGLPVPLARPEIPGFLSSEQLSVHHSAHYGGALRGYHKLDKELEAAHGPAFATMQRARTKKANSVVLHELYFAGMTAKESTPKSVFARALIKRFGSVDKWQKDFAACAKSARGWATLCYHTQNGKLYNVVSDGHADGVLHMAKPLVVLDVYEHAFYIDYKNDKAKYIDTFFAHIDWRQSERRFRAA